MPLQALFDELHASPNGLTVQEATKRLKDYGANTLVEKRQISIFYKLLVHFKDLFGILLLVASALALIGGMLELSIAILAVVLLNVFFSLIQESRAEKAMQALKNWMPEYAKVMRNGELTKILVREIVPGDVIVLKEGDRVPADARLVEAFDLWTNNVPLTGESEPQPRSIEPGRPMDKAYLDSSNLVFMSTSVAKGQGKAVVFATGMNTQFGKIAHLTQSVGEELSPLQKEMARVTRVVTVLAVGIGVFFFILGVLLAGASLAESFIFSLGMIVAFVPEGMLPTVTLSLAMGVQRMAKRHALIKRLSAVETLGSTTVICTDKTGTLTQNEMTVREVWISGRSLTLSGTGYDPQGQFLEQREPIQVSQDGELWNLLMAAALGNNAHLLPPNEENAHWSILGDPTEAALIVAAAKGGIDLEVESRAQPRLRELPFDSRRKRMSTIHQVKDAQMVYCKGAPKEIMSLCLHIRMEGKDVPLQDAQKEQISAAIDLYARNGLRVLAVAQRSLPADEGRRTSSARLSPEEIETDLTFLGLMAMMDPPRPEVTQAVEKCHTAGIRIVMITGDYGLTAESIASRIGIIRTSNPRIVTGVELDGMDERGLREALQAEVIFARVSPEHKLRVVGALKEMGEIVAVTGDGVNDAPALKRADIGVAMGVAGTDVAKEAADMILTNDNFAAIVDAVEEGRAVYSNIRKFAMYVFNSNMAEAVPFVFFLFSGGRIPLPLTVMQVLSIDLGTDMVPAIGLGAEPPERGLMQRPPRSQREPLLNLPVLVRALLWYGMIESVASMSAYFFLNWLNGWPGVALAPDGTLIYRMATTMTLAGVVTTQIGAVFGCRTDRESIFRIGFFTNRLVLVGIAVELVLLCSLIYLPFLHGVFNTAPIGLREWAYVFAWTPVIFLADELRKAFLRWRERR